MGYAIQIFIVQNGMPQAIVMLRQLIGAAAIIVLFAGAGTRAQVLGDSPNTGLGAAVANSRGSIGSIMRPHGPESSWPDYEAERQYREVLKRIPDRKPSNDPWGNIRQAPAAASVDKHRAQ